MSLSPSAANLDIRDLVVKFGPSTAVHGANLSVESGEFFTLLGPSGCGKTTILRTIAGFNRQTSGSVLVGGQAIDALPPYKRDTGLVFQNYAVFPHLTVAQNVAYGLKSRGVNKRDEASRVAEALAMVDLKGYEDRLPKQLSGGQQQRVVIARAIVVRPRVLLMDEPLANLDAKLRVRLRRDLKMLQKDLGITTIYVTHDQEEALSLSDRIAVMSGGHVLQVGTPDEVYRRPGSLAVAEFIGEGNFFHASIDDALTAKIDDNASIQVAEGSDVRGEAWVGFRPEEATLATPDSAGNGLTGRIIGKTYLGSYVRYDVDCGIERPVAVQTVDPLVAGVYEEDQLVRVEITADRVMSFPGTEKEREL